ncbi:MAG: response regulator transcription factor [Comamonadaceae bacterium]|nr:MAG: response regulator transcription factor [Comamonadaceae bacterium]
MKILVVDDHALFRAGLRLLLLSIEPDAQVLEAGSLKKAAPDMAAVVVSASQDPATIRACLDAGAMSYVPKSTAPDMLSLVLRRVMAGTVFLPPDMLALSRKKTGLQTPVLTRRQHEVLRALGRGMPSKSIARELGISEPTVKEHIGALFAVLRVSNRTEAVVTASVLGLWSAPTAASASTEQPPRRDATG